MPARASLALGPGHIDDGYWQGAPVWRFWSRVRFRGAIVAIFAVAFATGVHKCQTVYANQFAMFQKTERRNQRRAKVCSPGIPEEIREKLELDYPVV